MEQQYHWWQTGIIYQIYPRSFQDSNADGVGDLPGIIRRLNYLQFINIDAIWISPIYPSPMVDFGYDVSDYTSIDPQFGTMQDFDRLVAEAHARGLKVIMDFVPNHSSDQHPWFLESCASRDNPKRDWYLWADPAPGGGPPNNWLSEFGGSGWEWDEGTGQYYFHRYTKEQVDLNWRNPEVRHTMYDVMRFWLDRGVDGFRVDAVKNVIKDAHLRDNPLNPDFIPGMEPFDSQLHIYDTERPESHEVIREMRQVVDRYVDRMMVGEIYLPIARLMKYHGENLDEFQLVYNFSLIALPWNVQAVSTAVTEYEAALPEGAWPNWVLGNHDRHRVASRIGPEQARVAQMLLLTLRGTPTCYYGDEIGMVDVDIPPDKVVDPWELNVPGLGLGRDPERTPMQWDSSPHAGFSTVEPWLPVAPDYEEVNVAVQSHKPGSMLALFKSLTALRRATPALTLGGYTALFTDEVGEPVGRAVFAYTRNYGEQSLLVALNFTGEEQTVDLSKVREEGDVLLSTELDRSGREPLKALRLRANEGLVIGLTA